MSISPQSLARTRDKRSLRVPARFDDFSEIPGDKDSKIVKKSKSSDKTLSTSQHNSVSQPNLEKKLNEKEEPSEKTLKSLNNKEEKPTESVIRKSPFHPSITISNSSKVKTVSRDSVAKDTAAPKDSAISNDSAAPKEPAVLKYSATPKDSAVSKDSSVSKYSAVLKDSAAKPLLEKSENPVDSRSRPSFSKTAASRKKSQGFSLMVKQNAINISTNQGTTNIIGNHQNRSIPTQQTKFISNINQNLQYGPTRLLFNEPIYLPRTVAPIAPITTTLQQIANQARKPPFISKKTEAFIAYQEERKVDYLMSMHTAIVKVLSNLGPRDVANLRLVNKSWKSIADCEAVWKSVTLKTGDVDDFKVFSARILMRFRTSEIIFDNFIPKDIKNDAALIGQILCDENLAIKHIGLHTQTQMASRFAVCLLEQLVRNESKRASKEIRITWRPKVYVDDIGKALIAIGNENTDGIFEESDDLVEIDDIEASLDDLRTSRESGYKTTIGIQPV